jgi:Zn-dependent protease with chaperone function
MRLNSANRAFAAIVAVAAVAFGLFAAAACWAFGMVLYRIANVGPASLAQTSTVPALVLIALLVVGSVLAIRSFRAQAANTRRLGQWVRECSLPVNLPLSRAAGEAGLAGRVVLVDAAAPFSFAYGMTRPKVAVSRGLLDSVSAQELTAVLHHERYHVASHDPFKVVLARSLPSALFFLPALDDVRGRYVTGRELAADRRAIRTAGPETLAGALYKAISGPAELELGAAAAIGGDDALDARVAQLESGSEPSQAPLSRRRLVASLGGASLLVWSAVGSFVAFAPIMARLCTGP